MPARRATPRTSPFLAWFERMSVAATVLEKCTVHLATAVRFVVSLDEMDTICAAPEDVRCVSVGALISVWDDEVAFGLDFGLASCGDESFSNRLCSGFAFPSQSLLGCELEENRRMLEDEVWPGRS